MLADALEDKFDIIIFHKIDRNSHNELNYFIFKDKLKKLGIRYEYAAQSIDSDTAEGQMMEAMLVSIAAYYSRNLAKEIKKGLNENAYKAQFNVGMLRLATKSSISITLLTIKKLKRFALSSTHILTAKDTVKSAWHSQLTDTLHVAKKTFRRTVCMIFSVMI